LFNNREDVDNEVGNFRGNSDIRQCQYQSKFFSVAKIAELLRSPQRRSRVTVQNQEMIVEKEMFLGVDGQQVGMEMIEYQLAVSSIGVMQRLERSVDRRL